MTISESPAPPLAFDGEVAVVTGAGRGIGAGYARELASRGCRVVVNDLGVDRDGAPLAGRPADAVVAEIRAAGGEAVADVNDVAMSAEAVVDSAISAFGRLDIVINNAGTLGRGGFADVSLDVLDRVLATHVRGAFAITQAALPHLVASGRGRVLLTSSTAVWGAPGSVCYSVAKAAVLGLAATLAQEAGPRGVRTNAVMPAAWTRLTSDTPQGDLADFVRDFFDPRLVAGFGVWLVHRDTTANGEVFVVGGGRAGKVFIGQAPGVNVASPEAEDWVGRDEQLVARDGYVVPTSMLDELGFQASQLGAEPLAAWNRFSRY